MPAFAAMSDRDREAVLTHMVAEGWLFDDQGMLSIGPEAERSLGWRNFMELTGIVTSDPEIVVRYGKTEVGRLHPVSFRSGDAGYEPILLGGRSWQVTRIDWRRSFADVVPDSRPGRSRWNGDARPLRGVLCREMRACLSGSDIAARLTRRGAQTLEGLREELWWAEDGSTAIVADVRGNQRWWTFAGLRANASSPTGSGHCRGSRSRDNLSIGLAEGLDRDEYRRGASIAAGRSVRFRVGPLHGGSSQVRGVPPGRSRILYRRDSLHRSRVSRGLSGERIRIVAGAPSRGGERDAPVGRVRAKPAARRAAILR